MLQMRFCRFSIFWHVPELFQKIAVVGENVTPANATDAESLWLWRFFGSIYVMHVEHLGILTYRNVKTTIWCTGALKLKYNYICQTCKSIFTFGRFVKDLSVTVIKQSYSDARSWFSVTEISATNLPPMFGAGFERRLLLTKIMFPFTK